MPRHRWDGGGLYGWSQPDEAEPEPKQIEDGPAGVLHEASCAHCSAVLRWRQLPGQTTPAGVIEQAKAHAAMHARSTGVLSYPDPIERPIENARKLEAAKPKQLTRGADGVYREEPTE